ncbi:hypothetical protein E0L93_13390 [Rubrobacter taiwanensis]|uniref:CARDB domain-containing protein n=1 Tax=Rubrobacter taiwanensis TaxID=185139 RepID=A0A4R1BDK0_9ACTN|nr:hypothetical protein [Rubrobacter taiwanensis]TCJ15143.1 hypothetical protein E0L93_13390 [Rubrobacter taiwanensis]
MRSLALWTLAAAGAFFITASAFLLLATVGSEPSELRITPSPDPESPSPALELSISEERLGELEAEENQPLEVTVINRSGEPLSDVNLSLRVSSEDTATTEARYYRASVEHLPPGEEAEVRFELNLSPFGTRGTLDNPRKIIEVQASTPAGATAVATAILTI